MLRAGNELWLILLLLAGAPALASEAGAERERSAAASLAPKTVIPRVWHAREKDYYRRNWGVEIVGVQPVSSGWMLAFRYRILDPEKARILNDRKHKAYLIDEATGVRLAVPTMEKVGQLRTGADPKADRTYFMIFEIPASW